MTDNGVTLSREQVTEIFKAISGTEHLLKRLASRSGNASEVYAIMSNLSVIEASLSEMPRISSN